jgi:hypothetical protein
MKKAIILSVGLMVGSIGAFAQTKPAQTGSAKKPATVYTCTMHPEVTSNKPGKCPKCGMELVVKKNAGPDPATQKKSMNKKDSAKTKANS